MKSSVSKILFPPAYHIQLEPQGSNELTVLPAVMGRTKVTSLASESLTRMTQLNLRQYVKIQGVHATLGRQTQKMTEVMFSAHCQDLS